MRKETDFDIFIIELPDNGGIEILTVGRMVRYLERSEDGKQGRLFDPEGG